MFLFTMRGLLGLMLTGMLAGMVTGTAASADHPALLNYAVFKVRERSLKEPVVAFLIHNHPRVSKVERYLTIKDLPRDVYVWDTPNFKVPSDVFNEIGPAPGIKLVGPETPIETHFRKFPRGLFVSVGFSRENVQNQVYFELDRLIRKGRFSLRAPNVPLDELSLLIELNLGTKFVSQINGARLLDSSILPEKMDTYTLAIYPRAQFSKMIDLYCAAQLAGR